VKLSGAIISHVFAELEVTCLPADLPEFIEVDLTNIEVGHSIHLADLKLPKGVAAVSQENLTIATASIPAGKVEADAPAAEAPAADAPAADKK
jgi:large subunit ribosomal protein L25